MWIARIARPGAIYDASAAAQTFSVGEMGIFTEEEETEVRQIEEVYFLIEEDLYDHMPGFARFKSRKQEADKANILKRERRLTPRKPIYGTKFNVFKTGYTEIERGREIPNQISKYELGRRRNRD